MTSPEFQTYFKQLANINFPGLLHKRENGFLEIRYDFSLAVQQTEFELKHRKKTVLNNIHLAAGCSGHIWVTSSCVIAAIY